MTKVGSLVLFGSLLLPAVAGAQDRFGTAGQFAISAERITSINHSSRKTEDDESDVTVTTSTTNIALLTNPVGGFTTGYSFPRLAGDYFVTDGLSVGAAIGVFSTSFSSETEIDGESEESDGPTSSGVLVAPRVGYAFMFGDNIGLWPRGGVTYIGAGSEQEDGDESSTRLFALSVEAPFVFVPVPHVAFLAGPALDLGLSGSDETDPDAAGAPNQETEYKITDFGLHVGMTAYF